MKEKVILAVAFALSLSCTAAPQPTRVATPELFNLGRTRNFTRGMSVTRDGSQVFVTIRGPDRNSAGGFRDHVGMATYTNGEWSAVDPLPLFPHVTSDRDPVISPDGRRLYFSSTASDSGSSEQRGFRIWFAERTIDGWSAPVLARGLNIRPEASVSSITEDGTIYLVAGSIGDVMSTDVFAAQLTEEGFTTPVAVDAWNTTAGEHWVAVDPAGRFAFIVRNPVTDSVIVMQSTRQDDGWSAPTAANFRGASSLRPYSYRYPFVSHDRSTLLLTSATRLFAVPLDEALHGSPGGERLTRYAPRPVPTLGPGEPEIIEPVALRSTNGIAFTNDGRTVYLSQWGPTALGQQGQPIRLAVSHRSDTGWSQPVPLPFGEPSDSRLTQEYHPVLSPDGNTMYFNSRRQRDGTAGETNDLWRVRRTSSGEWGPREHVAEASTEWYDDYASVTNDGSVYFRSDRPGGAGGGDIYVMRMVNGHLQPPVNVAALNSPLNENDAYVDADERFIVFNRYNPATTDLDLFISVRGDSGWRPPRPLSIINTVVDYELTPTLSRDGEYLYVEVAGAILRWRVEELLTDDERRLVRQPNANRVPR